MTVSTANTTAPFGAITVFKLVGAVESTFAALVAWNTARRTYKTLYSLSDSGLSDIGLSRGDLKNRTF